MEMLRQVTAWKMGSNKRGGRLFSFLQNGKTSVFRFNYPRGKPTLMPVSHAVVFLPKKRLTD
jgi:hypothetical protein